MATGVLPLACGRATRLVRFLTASDKDYDATVQFGRATDTYDTTGTETTRSDRRPDEDAVRRAIASLSGSYLQLPPPYSAKKIAGRRAYELARRSEAVVLTPAPVTVSRAVLLSFDGDSARIALTCSAGFYVRSFAHSLGELTGTAACLDALRRTRSGEFTEAAAVPLAALVETAEPGSRLVPIDRLLTAFPAATLSAADRDRVSHGQELTDTVVDSGAPGGPWVRLLDADGRLVALGTPGRRPGSLHPAVVLI
jgi:tRNA pseudouridine55 synthase